MLSHLKSTSTEVFTGVQALRFLAAMLVVATHATFFVGERIDSSVQVWDPGAAGVDIFFVISGFVMAIASAGLIGRPDAWRTFLGRRLTRIVPPYWLATTLKVAIVAAVPTATVHSELNLPHLIASYLFVPTLNGEDEMKPILAVGWTLIFEMFFYAWFAIALALRTRPVVLTSLLFLALAWIAQFRTPNWPVITLWLDSILLEFVLGMLIAVWFQRGGRLNPLAAAVLTLSGFVGVILLNNDHMFQLRFLYQGMPAALLVLGVVGLEPVLRGRLPAWLLTLGDASYSLYLFHSFAVPAIVIACAKLKLGAGLALLLAMLIPIPLSWLIYRWLELPTLAWFKSRRETTGVRTAPPIG